MDKKDHVLYWRKSAWHDLDSATAMLDAGRFDWCLFVGRSRMRGRKKQQKN